MDEPTTKPSGSNPASPSSTYSDTDRSEVNTPPGFAPAVSARRLSAACGSHVAPAWSCPRLNNGITAPHLAASASRGCRLGCGPGPGLGFGFGLQLLLVGPHLPQRIGVEDVRHRAVAA